MENIIKINKEQQSEKDEPLKKVVRTRGVSSRNMEASKGQ